MTGLVGKVGGCQIKEVWWWTSEWQRAIAVRSAAALLRSGLELYSFRTTMASGCSKGRSMPGTLILMKGANSITSPISTLEGC